MAKRQFKVVQFDSEQYYLEVVNLMLFGTDIEVIGTAVGKQNAVGLLSKVKSGDLTPDLAIIDTELEMEHTEGEKVAGKLKEFTPNIKIIAYTILKDEEFPWADYIAIKSNRDPARTIAKTLSEITGAEIAENNQVDRS